MRLYDVGAIPWKQTQLVYHALAECSEESVVICSPKEAYSCVGFHQDVLQELDIDYCKENKIGFFRRGIGGGTVLLDQNQIFYQIIINRKKAPLNQKVLFEKYLDPVIKTYRSMGIDASYNPVSDVVVNGRKISGNGGGDIGSCKVMTGSMLLDFDCETMCRVLNLPSERFRANVCDTMKENLTSVKKELGHTPDKKEIISLLLTNFGNMFGNLERAALGGNIKRKMRELDVKFSSKEWLFKKRKQKTSSDVKIREGVSLIYVIHRGVELCIDIVNTEIRNIEIFSQGSQRYLSELNELLVGNNFSESLIINSVDLVLNR